MRIRQLLCCHYGIKKPEFKKMNSGSFVFIFEKLFHDRNESFISEEFSKFKIACSFSFVC